MFGRIRAYFGELIEGIRERLSDALESVRERLFGRDEGEGEEWDETEEVEELKEAVEEVEEEVEEFDTLELGAVGEIGDEEVIDLIEELEEVEEEAESGGGEDAGEDDGADDEARIVYALFEQAAESLAENEHILTTDELSRAESLLEEAAALLDELNELGEEDRAAAVDLIVEALAEVEAIVARAIERVDREGSGCEDARGPFVSYADAVAYARSIPCPAWVYADGYGWWWVCMDDCSPEQ